MFGKIFEQIYDSSIAEDWTVRMVFQDFIVLADINGVVDKTPEAISRRTNVPLEIVKKAILSLESQDPNSRSPEEDGRRIRRLDDHREWGWEIINYQRYRDIASDEQRRENTRIRTRNWRDRNKLQVCDAPVTLGDAGDAMQKQRERERERYISPVAQLMAIKEEIERHPANRDSSYYSSGCTAEQRTNLKDLRKRHDQINSEIANGNRNGN